MMIGPPVSVQWGAGAWLRTHGVQEGSPPLRYLLALLGHEPRHLVAIPNGVPPLPASWACPRRLPGHHLRTTEQQGPVPGP